MGARCRLCAESYDDLVDALDEAELSTKILQFFRVKIVADDRLPTTICRRCYDAINATWEFNEQVQKAQELLLAVEEANKATLLEQQNKNSVTMVECVLTDTTTEQPKPKIKTKVSM